jgi:hypothetical protein
MPGASRILIEQWRASAVRKAFPCLLQVALKGVFPPCGDCSAPCGLRRNFERGAHEFWAGTAWILEGGRRVTPNCPKRDRRPSRSENGS